MSDIAKLGFEVESGGLKAAVVDLDKLTASAKTADVATNSLAGASRVMAEAAGIEDAALVRLTATERLASQVTEAEATVTKIAAAAHAAHGDAAGVNSGQVMALTHVMRSMTEQIAMGVSPLQALTGQFSHLSYLMSAPGGITGALGGLAGALAPALPVILAVGAAVAGVAAVFEGMTVKINETARTQVSFGNVFMATIQVAAESIGHFLRPAIDQLGTWFRQFVDWFSPIFKGVGNTIINVFSAAFDVVKDTWTLLPDAFASIFTKAMNGAIDIVQNGINGIIGPINDLLAKVNLPGIGRADLSGFKGKPSNADQKVGGIVSRDVTRDMSADPMGAFFGAVSDKSQQLALDEATKATDKLGHSMKSANDNAKLLQAGLKGVGGVTDMVAESQRALADTALGAFGRLTGGLSQLFKDNKAIGLANAAINTAEGITKALAQGGIFGFVGAAGVAAAGAAQIAAILSAQPGSSSTPAVSGGGAAATAQSTAAAPAQGTSINLTIRGSGSVNVDDFASQLAQSIADGGNQRLIKVIRAA